jgi:hypothetical protein
MVMEKQRSKNTLSEGTIFAFQDKNTNTMFSEGNCIEII